MSDENFKKRFKEMADKVVKSENKKLYPVSDKDLKAIRDKSEDDTNSYSKINKSIIDKMKLGNTKDLPPVSDKDVEIIKKRLKKLKGE